MKKKVQVQAHVSVTVPNCWLADRLVRERERETYTTTGRKIAATLFCQAMQYRLPQKSYHKVTG